MKQVFLLLAGVALFIIAVGIFSKNPQPKKSPQARAIKKEITIGNTKVLVEVADDKNKRQKGLGGRESLDENEGLLFIFSEKTSGTAFWMKGMKFPIDIIWITDGKIVKIDKHVQPEPGVVDDKLKRYYPETPINYALEVNAGFADKNAIMVEDRVDLPKL